MADYKIVDCQQLDGDLTVLADAIRQRSGTDQKLAFPEGMADTVRNIPSDGVTLPTLTNPGSAGDLADGKQLIDGSGNVIRGNIQTAQDMYPEIYADNVWASDGNLTTYWAYDGDEKFIMARNNTEIISHFPLTVLGDAEPGDVRKGKYFTSTAGVHVEGTMEEETGGASVSVDGETLVFEGTATLENETLIL